MVQLEGNQVVDRHGNMLFNNNLEEEAKNQDNHNSDVV
jgi:hypothetical protein